VILTARELNPGVRIVAAASVRDNIEELADRMLGDR